MLSGYKKGNIVQCRVSITTDSNIPATTTFRLDDYLKPLAESYGICRGNIAGYLSIDGTLHFSATPPGGNMEFIYMTLDDSTK